MQVSTNTGGRVTEDGRPAPAPLRPGARASSTTARQPRADPREPSSPPHEAFIASTPVETLEKAVNAFKEAGVMQVHLNMGLFPWVDQDKPTIEKYDAVVNRIRRAGDASSD